jgi:carbamoyl-phosphate synthase large subunit
MQKLPIIAVSGLHRGDNPQPGSAVVRSIRRRFPSARVVGLSYDPLESGLFTAGLDEVEAAYSMPFPGAGHAALLKRLDEIAKLHTIGMIIPCLDAEIPNYLAAQKEITKRKIKVVLPSAQAFERRSKDRLNVLGAEAGVGSPRTIVAPDLSSAFHAASVIGYPLYVKGRLYEARKVYSPAELPDAFYQMTSVWGGPALVQEVVSGDEYDVIGLGDGEGRIVASCAIRKLLVTKAGKAFSGVVVSDPTLQDHAERIISVLKWNGPFELEFISQRDSYALIEVNPRFPAWCDFPSQLGCNLPAAMLERAFLGSAKPISVCEPGRLFVRHCIDVVGDIAELAALSVTGTLARTAEHPEMEIA